MKMFKLIPALILIGIVVTGCSTDKSWRTASRESAGIAPDPASLRADYDAHLGEVMADATLTLPHPLVSRNHCEIVEADAIPVIIGGDHSLEYPNVAALADVYGRYTGGPEW